MWISKLSLCLYINHCILPHPPIHTHPHTHPQQVHKAHIMATTKQKVLVLETDKSEHASHTEEYKQFCNLFEVKVYRVTTLDAFIEELQGPSSDISALWATGHSIWSLGGVLKVVDHLPSTLKVYCYSWVGYLDEEADALRKRGIVFCNVGDVSQHDVADQALYLTLSCFRFANFFEHQFRPLQTIMASRAILGSQGWDKSTGEPLPSPDEVNLAYSSSIGGKKVESPGGKIAGIVGLGAIGKQIGKRLDAIGMKVRYTKRSPLSEEESHALGYAATYVPTFEELIKEVDLIVIAVPHSPETIHLINEESLKTVKRGVRIVNIGRGSAIDEEALFKALDDGTVCSVGLDVFDNEPNNIDPRWAKRWDATITPHSGNITTDNTVQSNFRCMANIKNVLLDGGKGLTPIP